MSIKILLVFLILLFSNKSFAQIEGYVMDHITKKGLPYVKVGYRCDSLNASVLSDSKGYFIFDSYNNDKIKFLKPGYDQEIVNVTSFVEKGKIYLTATGFNKNKAFIPFNQNTTIFGNNLVKNQNVTNFPTNIIGGEMGVLVGEPNSTFFLKSINIYIAWTKLDTISFRINVYKRNNDGSVQLQNKVEIIGSKVVEDKNTFEDWVKYDVSFYGLKIEGECIVSIENIYIEDIKNNLDFAVKGILPGKNSNIYYRYSPLSNFYQFPLKIGLYAELIGYLENE